MNKKKIEKTLPLSDYVVLDLTIARAGPTAVRLLSDWGADVIRIEAPVEGDMREAVKARTLKIFTEISEVSV